MNPSSVYILAAVTAVLAIAYAARRWRGLSAREALRQRMGATDADLVRWGRSDAMLARVPGLGLLARRAQEANLPLGVTDLVLLALALAYPLFLAFERLVGPTAARPLVVVLIPWGIWVVVDGLARRRRERIVQQIPDVVRLLAGGAKAGLSMTGAASQAANDIGDPIASELRRLVTSVGLGRVLPDALDDLGRRVGSRDLDVVVSSIAIQQRTGGDLVALMTRLGEGMDISRRARQEARGYTAGLGFQAYVGVILGVGGIVLINRVTDGGLERALAQPLPLAVIIVSAILLAISIPLVKRITRLPS